MNCHPLNCLPQCETSVSSGSLTFFVGKAGIMIAPALRNGFKDKMRRQVIKALANSKFLCIASSRTCPYINILKAGPI